MGSALSAFTEDHPRPWTTAEWLALGELPAWPRLELIDGSLHLSPHATLAHQWACGELYSALRDAVSGTGLRVFTPANVILDGTSALIPDVVVCRDGVSGLAAQATDVLLVCEVESPSTRKMDRMVKAAAYAQAGIGHYWRVELSPGPVVCRYGLHEGAYHLIERVPAGQTLYMPDGGYRSLPAVEFDPDILAL